MKHNEQREMNIFHYVDKVHKLCNKAIDQCKSNEELHEQISSLCLKCLKPADEIENCDMCNGHSQTTDDQLYLNFEGLSEE